MRRQVRIVFDVDDSCTLSRADLYDIAEQIVTAADPQPPVLTFEGIEVVELHD